MVADAIYPDRTGGSFNYVYELGRHLVGKGHAVAVLTEQVRSALPRRETIEGMDVWRYPGVPEGGNPLQRFFFRHRAVRFTAGCLLSSFTPDVIHGHAPVTAFSVLTHPAARRLPKLFTFHGPLPLEKRSDLTAGGSALTVTSRAMLTVMQWVEGQSVRRSQRLVTLSTYMQELARSLYGVPVDRFALIPGGVDAARFAQPGDGAMLHALRRTPGDLVLLTVRRLTPRMGLELLIDAVARLVKDQQHVRLAIGGTGPLRADLEQQIARLGLQQHVVLLGFIPDDQLAGVLQAADLFVMPSRELEGFGLSTVEALAAGTPVLGTPVGGTREILSQLGQSWLTAETSIQAIEDGLRRWIASGPRKDRLKPELTSFAQQFRWEIVTDRYEDEFRKLVTEGVR